MPLEKGGSGSHLVLFCAVVHHPDAHGAFRRYGKGGDAGKVKFGAQTLLRVQADAFGFGGGLFSFGHGISPQYRLPEKGVNYAPG